MTLCSDIVSHSYQIRQRLQPTGSSGVALCKALGLSMQSSSFRYGLSAYPLSAPGILLDLDLAQHDIVLDAAALVAEKIYGECQYEFER